VTPFPVPPMFGFPITFSNIGRAYGKTGSHEMGHLLGLTAEGGVLDGRYDGSGHHNRFTFELSCNIMDGWEANDNAWHMTYLPYGFHYGKNYGYLKFILPTTAP